VSYIRIPPQVTEVETVTCQFHKDYPAGQWAGCTCMTSVRQRDKRLAEMTDAERAFMYDPYPGAFYP
jgi:hypothetical protein